MYLASMGLAACGWRCQAGGWRCQRLVKDLSANRRLYLAATPVKVCSFTKISTIPKFESSFDPAESDLEGVKNFNAK